MKIVTVLAGLLLLTIGFAATGNNQGTETNSSTEIITPLSNESGEASLRTAPNPNDVTESLDNETQP